jgi:anti-anti-sigma factor
MNVKIDTKEIFYVISITEEKLSANMAVELIKLVTEKQKEANKSIILDFTALAEIDKDAIDLLVKWHEKIYQDKKSLVIFGLSNPVKSALDEAGLLELVNHTPTESEAWDIVQMEEIVRELDTDFE